MPNANLELRLRVRDGVGSKVIVSARYGHVLMG